MISHLSLSRHLGLASPRRRIPASRPPTLIESDYAHRLVGVVNQLRGVVSRTTQHLRFDDSRALQARRALERARQEVDHGAGSVHLDSLAYDYGRRVNVHQRNEFQRQARAAVGVDIMPLDPHINSLIDGFVHESVTLVRKLQGTTLYELEVLLTRAAVDGLTGAAVAEQIEARFGIAERHARLLARDQIGKLESRLTQARCQEIGIGSYDWVSLLVGPNRRKHHVERHGRRYRYDSPPADGHPGRAICCQCRMAPSWDELRAAVDVPNWQAVVR